MLRGLSGIELQGRKVSDPIGFGTVFGVVEHVEFTMAIHALNQRLEINAYVGRGHSHGVRTDSVGVPASDIGVYLQPLVQGVNCHCEFNVFYNAENRSEADRVKRLSALAIRSQISHGAFFSRPYEPNVEMIMNRDAASVNALRKIKAIIDPENIMNPGSSASRSMD